MTLLTPKRQQNLIAALELHTYCRIQESEGWYRPNCRQTLPKKQYCDRCKLIDRIAEGLKQ